MKTSTIEILPPPYLENSIPTFEIPPLKSAVKQKASIICGNISKFHYPTVEIPPPNMNLIEILPLKNRSSTPLYIEIPPLN